MQRADPQTERWLTYVREWVRGESPPPFTEQERVFAGISAERPSELGPQPAWAPHDAAFAESNAGRFAADRGLANWEDLHRWSVEHRGDFWSGVIDVLDIPLAEHPSVVLGSIDPTDPRWLAGSTLDITAACFSADERSPAVIFGREGGSDPQVIGRSELEALVDRVAHGVAALGLEAGDGVALVMPMTPECVAAYLGIVRAGHPVVSIADSFAADEVAKRLRLGRASAVVTVDHTVRGGRIIDLYAKVRAAGAPTAVVVPGPGGGEVDLRPGDLNWADFLGPDEAFEPRPGPPSGVTNILFSSGTTGDPKVIPWTGITPLKCAMDGHFHQDIRPGDVVAWPTNIGWMMGPWLIYASLVNGATIALYEGLPSGDGFARFVERAGVTVLGVVPSLVRAWREWGACDDVDWTGIRIFSSTGEASNSEDYLWLMSRAAYRAPVIEYCGGTEIGGGYITGTVARPCSPATFTTPALGLDFVTLNEEGEPVSVGEEGEVFLVPPSIGLSERLLNRDHGKVYHDGCPIGPNGEVLRRHGDVLRKMPHGFWRAQGRADDTMNLGGIKVSSAELERLVEEHPAVFEAAAVAVQPDGEGAERLVLFLHLVDGEGDDDLSGELQREISSHLNPLFKIHDLVVKDRLPRTASGKVMRRILRDDYRGGR